MIRPSAETAPSGPAGVPARSVLLVGQAGSAPWPHFLRWRESQPAELKNPLNGQNVEDAVRQYKKTRDPREPFFSYGRCLAHFAVDPDLVFVTTQLLGEKSWFLPFNQGRFGGAGNPPVPPTQKGSIPA